MKKPIVVTGAAGFIGRNVVAELNARGHDNLLLVDNLGRDEKWRNLVGLEYEDIVDSDEFLSSVEKGRIAELEALIHLGACSSTTERNADFLLQNNYHYTRALCDYCLRENTRFIYASSAATYGDGSHGYSDDVTQLPTLTAAEYVRIFQAHVRSVGAEAQVVRSNRRLEILQCFWSVRRPQGRHAFDGREILRADSKDREGRVIQILSTGLCRRRTETRFHLCQRCGRDDVAFSGASQKVAGYSTAEQGRQEAGRIWRWRYLPR